jgi:hypothetical protein
MQRHGGQTRPVGRPAKPDATMPRNEASHDSTNEGSEQAPAKTAANKAAADKTAAETKD